MSDWRLLDNIDGVKSWHKLEDGKTIIKTTQDVSSILDANQAARSNQSTNWKGDWHEVAEIPNLIWGNWYRELGSDPMAKENRAWLIAKLNSRDWCKLRTKEGRL